MTRPLDQHLEPDEIDGLISPLAAGFSDAGRFSERELADFQRHTESCPECRRKVQMGEDFEGELSRLRRDRTSPAGNAMPGPECFSGRDWNDDDWFSLAAGLMPEAETKERVKHASQCAHCGPLLREAVQILYAEPTAYEEQFLAALSGATPEWEKNLIAKLRSQADPAAELRSVEVQDETARHETARAEAAAQNKVSAEKSGSRWQRWFAWPSPAYAMAALAVSVAATWLGMIALRPPSAERLLAQAYSEHRTMEVRMPDAKFAPVRVERGVGQSNLDKSPALLKAEALIGEQLRRHPNDPAWLEARARADMLDGNYDSAIKTLQRALEEEPLPEKSENKSSDANQSAHPGSPSLLTDLGTAYYLRAESADRPIDYGSAIEYLSQALQKSPDDAIALFNRALACERMFLYTQAVDDWQHYLRIDPQGDWSNDARQRLTALQEKIKQHEKSQAEPLLTPEEIAKAGPDDAVVRAKIEERVEEYLNIATTEWLPSAFPASAAHPSLEARAALAELADLTRKNHRDNWLTDLLNGPRGGKFPAGAAALAGALNANERGDYSAAQSLAHEAARLLRDSGNSAAEIRAQAEEVYSDHLFWEGTSCAELLGEMEARLSSAGYQWINAQMALERSNCTGLTGDLGAQRSAILEGKSIADANGYSALSLRGLGFLSLSDSSLGDNRAAFSNATKGLSIYWPGHIDLMKAYNLYTFLDAAADGLGLANFQVATLREAAKLVDRQPDVLLQAMGHRWYGYAAYLANETNLSDAEFARAGVLFQAAPKSPSTLRHRANAEIWLAKIETRRGDFKKAADRLQEAKPLLDAAPSFGVEMDYYSAQADIALRTFNSSTAESAIRSAISLAEWGLTSYRTEEERRRWTEQTRDAYRDAVEWKLRQGDATAALELWEWYRGAELRANASPGPASTSLDSENFPDPGNAPPVYSPTVIANRLSSLRDETVAAYGVFPDGIAVWAYDDRGVFLRWTEVSAPAVRELASRFEKLCSDPASDLSSIRAVGRSLYDLLIGPVEDKIGRGRTIVFEADDALAGLPWDALVDRESRYLVGRAHRRPAKALARGGCAADVFCLM